MDWELIKDQIVKASTKDNTMPMYYAGGTLCIDFSSGLLCLNLNGQGFSVLDGKEERLTLSSEILKLVRTLYVETKGETEYYKRTVQEGPKSLTVDYILKAVQEINQVCGNTLTPDQIHKIDLICQDIALCQDIISIKQPWKPGDVKDRFYAPCKCGCPICENQERTDNSKA
jgi:hypothetical protein